MGLVRPVRPFARPFAPLTHPPATHSHSHSPSLAQPLAFSLTVTRPPTAPLNLSPPPTPTKRQECVTLSPHSHFFWRRISRAGRSRSSTVIAPSSHPISSLRGFHLLASTIHTFICLQYYMAIIVMATLSTQDCAYHRHHHLQHRRRHRRRLASTIRIQLDTVEASDCR